MPVAWTPERREGIVVEVAEVLEPDAVDAIVADLAVRHRRDAPLGTDAIAVVVGDGDAIDADVAGAVAQEQAGSAIVLEAAAEPAQCAHVPAAGAVAEVGAAQVVADHPRVGHQAFEDAALHIEAVATDAAHHDVVDRKIVDPAVVAVGDDLDAVALASVALDREIRQRQIAEVHAGTGIYLDDRRAVGDLRNDRCPAKIDAQGAADAACDVYDDGRGDRVGLPAHLRHVATGNRASERGSWIVARYLHGVAPPADCPSFQPMATMQLQRFRSGTMFTSIDCGLRRFRVPLQRWLRSTLGPVCVRHRGPAVCASKAKRRPRRLRLQSLHSWRQVGDPRGAHTRFTDCRADGPTLFRR